MKPITAEWIRIADGDWDTANRELAVTKDPNYKAVSFHSQQCGEKYLKAFLQENSIDPERTHDLTILINKILPLKPEWASLQESCAELTTFAVDHRYPGTTTSQAEATEAVYHANIIRTTVRSHFSLTEEGNSRF
jgi:HEPN domain-containing protein